MRCLKCGTEIEDTAAFCADCLQAAAKYPVSRETHIVIQPRPEYTPPRMRPAKAEELLAESAQKLRKSRRFSAVMVFICLILVVLLALSVRYTKKKPVIGQNYTTVETTVPPSATVPEA